ncbi:RNA-dependent ATPase rok1 [Varicellaria rhodocarpa]|nr:RNA-dependent ATPase rok1 [Varicellaria rhodocarpa]
MDPFKLLIRSTNLQKSAVKLPSDQCTPSAGVPSHPQILAEIYDASRPLSSSTKQGIKRKRRIPQDVQSIDYEHGSDCFGETPSFVSESSKAKPLEIGTLGDTGPLNATNEKLIDGDAMQLDQEERRKLLKKHKLKVTLMQKGIESHYQKKKKRRKETIKYKEPKKPAFAQLSPQPMVSFKELKSKYRVSKRLLQNLDEQGYRIPTEVQMGAIPLLLGTDLDRGLQPRDQQDNKAVTQLDTDLLTVAPTGSGKTLAFLIPIMHSLIQEGFGKKEKSAESLKTHQVKAIVVAPTHELVDQIVNEGRKLAIGTSIRITAMRKGMSLYQQDSDQQSGVGKAETVSSNLANCNDNHEILVKSDVLVSTPLVLLHSLSGGEGQNPTTLLSVRYLVLDEADVLLDHLFREQTLAIWMACINSSLHVSLWSATIGSSIETLTQTFIKDRREKLQLSGSSHHLIRLIVGLKDSALPTIAHRLIYAGSEQGKLLAIRQLLHPTTSSLLDAKTSLRPPFLIFTQTIPRATTLHSELLYDIPPEAGGSSRIAVLHSELSDNARSNVMAEFRKGEIWVLITTDLLSRGVDFRGINGIVNYDIPNTGASYVHRAGRTGRAGREGGVAVTLYTKDDIPYVKNIANVIAATQRFKAKGVNAAAATAEAQDGGIQKWLLDALPKVGKKMKKELKRKGVESRRNVEGREGKKARISTKSGFDRRKENRIKGARKGAVEASVVNMESDGEWGGFED